MDHFDVLDLQQVNPLARTMIPTSVDVFHNPRGGEEGDLAGRKGKRPGLRCSGQYGHRGEYGFLI